MLIWGRRYSILYGGYYSHMNSCFTWFHIFLIMFFSVHGEGLRSGRAQSVEGDGICIWRALVKVKKNMLLKLEKRGVIAICCKGSWEYEKLCIHSRWNQSRQHYRFSHICKGAIDMKFFTVIGNNPKNIYVHIEKNLTTDPDLFSL